VKKLNIGAPRRTKSGERIQKCKKKYFGWLRPLETRIRPKIKPVQGYEASRKSKPTDSDNNVHSLHFQAAKHFKIHKMSLK